VTWAAEYSVGAVAGIGLLVLYWISESEAMFVFQTTEAEVVVSAVV
jgi:hypothetical protein